MLRHSLFNFFLVLKLNVIRKWDVRNGSYRVILRWGNVCRNDQIDTFLPQIVNLFQLVLIKYYISITENYELITECEKREILN